MSDRERPRLFIDEVQLSGFKSIDSLKVTLMQGLNILIGKNGSGKSNFLDFLHQSITSIYKTEEPAFRSATISFGSNNGNKLSYSIRRKSLKSLMENPGEDADPFVQKFRFNDNLVFDTSNDTLPRAIHIDGKKYNLGRKANSLLNRLGYGIIRSLYIRYETEKDLLGLDLPASIQIPLSEDADDWDIKVTSPFLSRAIYDMHYVILEEFYASHSQNEDVIDRDVEEDPELDTGDLEIIQHFSAFKADDLIDRIELDENVKYNLELFSPIKDIRLDGNIRFIKSDTDILNDNIQLEFFVNGRWQSWNHLSDGTKRLFNIITEVTQKTRGILLIEEPELGIHPAQFHLLMQFLKEQSATKQILISTHSPKALDILQPDELSRILIANYDLTKGTQIGRMTEEQINKAHRFMSEQFLSDYWLMSDLEEDD